MHNFVTEMCTCVHISITKWCIMGYSSGALWDCGNTHSCFWEKMGWLWSCKPYMYIHLTLCVMVMSCQELTFHMAGPSWGESKCHRWFPLANNQQYDAVMFSLLLSSTLYFTSGRIVLDIMCHVAHGDMAFTEVSSAPIHPIYKCLVNCICMKHLCL